MAERLWAIYKIFHEPPGTPKELRCVGCKIAAGGACLTLMGASIYGVARTAKIANPFAIFWGLTFIGSLVGSSVSFRLAYDDDQYNKQLIERAQDEISRQRRLAAKGAQRVAPN